VRIGPLARAGRASATLTVAALTTAGCTYYNAIYNAERAYADAEVHRRAGRDTLAAGFYRDVIRKAARGYRREPDGPWAYQAAFLIGRARLRQGEVREARAALERSLELASDDEERFAAMVHLGMVEVGAARTGAALRLFNKALAGATDPSVRGEGHLHRGRILLAGGSTDQGWWDLDRAAEVFPPLRSEATLDRLRWAVGLGEFRRAAESLERLFTYPEAAQRSEEVLGLVRRAEDRWDADTASELLASAGASRWPREARDRVRLEHARTLARAGRVEQARRRAREVADGRSGVAAEARLQIARWTLAEAAVLEDTYRLRALLLPASDDPRVAGLLSAVTRLEELAFTGLESPLAWFAAGELARDRLGAPKLAAGLFLSYANTAADEPWAPKALLAAIEVTATEEERAVLRARLDAHASNPYVLAARGIEPTGFEALEEELLTRLQGIGAR